MDEQQVPTLEEEIVFLKNRLARLEAAVFPHFATQQGAGQRQIASDPSRKEVGQGPILNTGSEFI